MKPLVNPNGNIAYFGRLSWANFVDWLITFGLGIFLLRVTLVLGGARPEAHLELLPLLVVLLVLHGIWLAVDQASPKRISQIPLLFVPFLIWMGLSAHALSPASWLGRLEWIYALEAFIFFWIACNNVRTRAHLSVLLLFALIPFAVSLYLAGPQLNGASRAMNTLADPAVSVSSEYTGRLVGVLADPMSFAALLLTVIPFFGLAALIPRCSLFLRVSALILAVVAMLGVLMTQVVWAMAGLIPISLLALYLWRRLYPRRFIAAAVAAALLLAVIAGGLYLGGLQHPSVAGSLSTRMVLWAEAGCMFLQHPITGVGAGAFSMAFQQSAETVLIARPNSPQNDFLLLLSQYGLIGALLALGPLYYTLRAAGKRWRELATWSSRGKRRRPILSFEKFILSLTLAGCLGYLVAAFFSFTLSVPALLFYGLLFFSILVKYAFMRRCNLPEHLLARWSCFGVAVLLGGLLLAWAPSLLRADALVSRSRASLDQLVAQRLHLSAQPQFLDAVLEQYKTATKLDPKHADAWIGWSAATCQLYFRDLDSAQTVGESAAEYAKRAVHLSPDYAAAWGQLGVAQLLSGQAEAGAAALHRALELAPMSSEMHYLQAAYLSHFPERKDEAREMVERALELNPDHVAARRLSQRLFTL